MIVDSLLERIKITQDMTRYNICNILKGVDSDSRWLENRQRIQRQNEGLLGLYFNHAFVRDRIHLPGYNPGVFKLCVNRYIQDNKPPKPNDNEFCLHFRLGDRNLELDKTCLLNFDYYNGIDITIKDTITIVCNISFCGISSDIEGWKYSIDKLNIVKDMFRPILQSIIETSPVENTHIYSSGSVDLDLCYLISGGFNGHPDSSWTQMFKP